MWQEWFFLLVVLSIFALGYGLHKLSKSQSEPKHSSIEDEQYQQGREHALLGQKPLLKTEAYLDGYSDGRKVIEQKGTA
ncbi:hypothetical protein [Aeromonas hydrophila]|uniref:hypothetical protein n=1 Tax=Aeromonas hydrophila TaxID=644 RepID=UPI002B49EBFF|nr:hypothetical protein [Aeromonas hydrophila]